MTNMPHVIETALLLLVAFLIGCVIGYVLRSFVFASGKTEKEEPAPEKPVAAPPKATRKSPATTPPAKDNPVVLKAPREGGKDDLKRIKGIGPGIEKKLNDLGIFHFDQIAAWRRKDIAWIDNSLSFKGRVDRENWVPQAKQLAKGGE